MIGSERLQTLSVAAVLGVSLFLNVELVQKIRPIANEVHDRKADLFRRAHQLRVGDKPPVLKGTDLHGVNLSFGFGPGNNSGGIILYVLAADCHFCGANSENMRALEKQTRGRYRFVGLALRDSGIDSYVRVNKIEFPVLRSVPREVADAYGLYLTPETIVISSTGQVADLWNGAYSSEVQKRIEARLDVHLPGLVNLPGMQ